MNGPIAASGFARINGLVAPQPSCTSPRSQSQPNRTDLQARPDMAHQWHVTPVALSYSLPPCEQSTNVQAQSMRFMPSMIAAAIGRHSRRPKVQRVSAAQARYTPREGRLALIEYSRSHASAPSRICSIHSPACGRPCLSHVGREGPGACWGGPPRPRRPPHYPPLSPRRGVTVRAYQILRHFNILVLHTNGYGLYGYGCGCTTAHDGTFAPKYVFKVLSARTAPARPQGSVPPLTHFALNASTCSSVSCRWLISRVDRAPLPPAPARREGISSLNASSSLYDTCRRRTCGRDREGV